MKLSFLLLILPLCLAHCPQNHFKDDVFKKCTKCTPCHITLTPCTPEKDAVCAPFKEAVSNHRFQKNRMHFLDDTAYDSLEEEYHAKNFLPHQKDHVKKNSKHLKSKHDDKHHHKKKHYEFDDDDDNDDDIDESYDNYNDDFDFNFEKVDKPKKHKKHYEFTKKHFNKKLGDLLPSDEDYEDEKLDFMLDKDLKKNKKKTNHQKKVDEEELEELLLQSQKNFKIHKDHLLKNLKDEKGVEKLNKVRLNSPVLDFGSEESSDFPKHSRNFKGKKMSDSDALKALADLNDDDSDDLYSFLPNTNDKTYKPAPAPHKGKSSNQIIGQGKEVDDMLRAEMGKNFIYEKPKFSVIPFVVENTHTEKNVHSEDYLPSSFYKKKLGWDTRNESEEDKEIKTNEVVSLPFTAAETLVWDWQAVAVASAVASCLVFFLVVAIYFIVNTRHWKKVNKTYNRELEEVTTRIALMQPMLDLGSSESPNTSLFMKNIIAPYKEEEKKDVKV